jgi:hypothetical protein
MRLVLMIVLLCGIINLSVQFAANTEICVKDGMNVRDTACGTSKFMSSATRGTFVSSERRTCLGGTYTWVQINIPGKGAHWVANVNGNSVFECIDDDEEEYIITPGESAAYFASLQVGKCFSTTDRLGISGCYDSAGLVYTAWAYARKTLPFTVDRYDSTTMRPVLDVQIGDVLWSATQVGIYVGRVAGSSEAQVISAEVGFGVYSMSYTSYKYLVGYTTIYRPY